MIKKLLTFMFTLISLLILFCSIHAQWAKTYGSYWDDIAQSIQQTSDGGYIVAGYTESFGAGGEDFWVLKLDSSGHVEWERTYGGGNDDRAFSVMQTTDGGYIVAGETKSFGEEQGDFWALKLYSYGDIEWQRTYGGVRREGASSIQQTNDGGFIVAGNSLSFTGTYCDDFWILKLDSSGGIEWQRTYGGNDLDALNCIWEEAGCIRQTSDGGFIVAGFSDPLSDGQRAFWVLKLDSSGDTQWQRTFGGSDWDMVYSIQQTLDNGYIMAGCTDSFGDGHRKFWIIKLDSSGDITWQRIYGGEGNDTAYSIQQTSDGGYIAAGRESSFHAWHENLWILKLDSSGYIEWQRTYGGDDLDDVRSIRQTSDGGFIAAGYTKSFGAGNIDILLLKLFPDGTIDTSCDFIETTDITPVHTDASPVDTNAIPVETNVSPVDTNITPMDTNATVNLLCIAPEYTLTISAAEGGTTDPAPGTYAYYSGTEVRVKAVPDADHEFMSWAGDVPSGYEYNNPLTVTMDLDRSLEAIFQVENLEDDCPLKSASSGTVLASHVHVLRDFRDAYLMPYRRGRMFVQMYYKYSSFLAGLIYYSRTLREGVRIILIPSIVFSYLMLHFGPVTTAIMLVFILILPIVLISFYRRKLSRLEAKDPEAPAS